LAKNFLEEIKKAEQQASKIVDEALQEAKDKVEQSKIDASNTLEQERAKSDHLIRENRKKTSQANDELINNELETYQNVEITQTKKDEVTKKVLERIVSFLGNT